MEKVGADYPDRIGFQYLDKASSEGSMSLLATFQNTYSVPVWIGELSATHWAPNATKCLTHAINFFEKNSWGWAY